MQYTSRLKLVIPIYDRHQKVIESTTTWDDKLSVECLIDTWFTMLSHFMWLITCRQTKHSYNNDMLCSRSVMYVAGFIHLQLRSSRYIFVVEFDLIYSLSTSWHMLQTKDIKEIFVVSKSQIIVAWFNLIIVLRCLYLQKQNLPFNVARNSQWALVPGEKWLLYNFQNRLSPDQKQYARHDPFC